jgi:hypothetical protein
MKRTLFILLFVCIATITDAQNCIDAIIVNRNEVADTIFCKIMNEEETSLTVDNGTMISSIPKSIILGTVKCIRPMTYRENVLYHSLETLTMDQLPTGTAGAYFRKSAISSGIATGLVLVGVTSLTLGLTVFKDHKSELFWAIGGGVVTATSIYFFVRAWNQIYKGGKLLDLNDRSALYLNATEEGYVGLAIKF